MYLRPICCQSQIFCIASMKRMDMPVLLCWYLPYALLWHGLSCIAFGCPYDCVQFLSFIHRPSCLLLYSFYGPMNVMLAVAESSCEPFAKADYATNRQMIVNASLDQSIMRICGLHAAFIFRCITRACLPMFVSAATSAALCLGTR